MKSPISQSAKLSGMKIYTRSPLVKWGIIFGLMLISSLGFIFLQPIFGLASFVIIGIPVGITGWYFGQTEGIAAGLLVIILNKLLMAIFRDIPWFSVDDILGGFILIIIGSASAQIIKYFDANSPLDVQLNSRERFLDQLKQATLDILSTTDPADINNSLLAHLINLFSADQASLLGWDAAHTKVNLLTTISKSAHSIPNIPLEPDLSPMAEALFLTGRVQVMDQLRNSQSANKPAVADHGAFQTQAALGIPLIAREYKFEVILNYLNPRTFTPEEIQQAQQAGDQIALVLWAVSQEVEIQKRLKETNALVRIGQVLSETERVGLSTVLHLIVTSAKELIPATEQAVIHLLDEDQQFLKAEAVIGYETSVANWKLMRIHPNEGVAGQVIVSGETTYIPDITTDPRFLTLNSQPTYRSLMVAAVKSGDRKMGTISVQSSLVSAFTEDESRLLSALGTQAAVAIDNAHLLENIQQTLKEVNALYRVNQGLVASLETGTLLQDTVELLQKNFDYYHVQIYVVDQETTELVLRAGSSEIGEKLMKAGHHLKAGDGIIGYVAETGEPFFTNDVDKVHFFIRHPFLPHTKSELAVPVKIGGRILGVLDIQQVPPAYLTQRDIQLVSAVAGQLAVALQKADLYEELQVSLQQEKAIRNQLVQNERLAVMGRLLASVSHELNNPLQAIQNALFLLREEKGISSQGKQDLDIVLAESERMAHLIEQLRATYRPIQTEDFHPTQINNIVEDVHALISTHLRHNEITFEFQPDEKLPPILALSDQIRQVVLNLFMNAVEAMSDGGQLTVETRLSDDKTEIQLIVSDTGTGISPAILPNIFEAFVTNKQEGTGLGLTITYDIVIKHRGRITAQNNKERGSMFKVWLPIKNREIE
jgi:signal transduction histidine kinase